MQDDDKKDQVEDSGDSKNPDWGNLLANWPNLTQTPFGWARQDWYDPRPRRFEDYFQQRHLPPIPETPENDPIRQVLYKEALRYSHLPTYGRPFTEDMRELMRKFDQALIDAMQKTFFTYNDIPLHTEPANAGSVIGDIQGVINLLREHNRLDNWHDKRLTFNPAMKDKLLEMAQQYGTEETQRSHSMIDHLMGIPLVMKDWMLRGCFALMTQEQIDKIDEMFSPK